MKHDLILVLGYVLGLILFSSPGQAEQQPVSQEQLAVLVEELKQDARDMLKGKTFDEIPAAVQGLIQLGEPAVPALAELLHGDSAWLRWQAAWALQNLASGGKLTDAALPALMTCIRQEDDPQLHYPCISALGRLQIPQAISDFRKALHASSRETVIAAMKALGRQGPAAQEAVPDIQAAADRLMGARRYDGYPGNRILKEVLESIEDETVWLARRLDELANPAQAGAPHIVRELIALRAKILPACEPREPRDPLFATWLAELSAAGQSGNQSAIQELIAVAKKCGNDQVFIPVVYELRPIGAPVVTILLQELENAETWQEQRQIVRVIGDIGLQAGTVVPWLEKLMTHEEPSLREAAAKALDRIRQTNKQG